MPLNGLRTLSEEEATDSWTWRNREDEIIEPGVRELCGDGRSCELLSWGKHGLMALFNDS